MVSQTLLSASLAVLAGVLLLCDAAVVGRSTHRILSKRQAQYQYIVDEPDPIKAARALDDQAQLDQLTTDPSAAIQGSAKAWSAGLSALLTLVVAGIWVGGQSVTCIRGTAVL